MHMSLLYRSTVTVVVQQVVDFLRVKSIYDYKVQWLQLALLNPT
jgi:hypothetical protein